jgi:hypothetical protein
LGRWGGDRIEARKAKRKEVNDMSNSIGSSEATSPAVKAAAPKGLELELTLLHKGLDSALPDGTSLTLAGVSWTKAALVTELAKDLEQFQAVKDQVRILKSARQAKQQSLSGARTLTKNLKSALVAYFGRGSPMLAPLGIRVGGGGKALTSEQKVLRAAKAKATRAVRHTLGARQKRTLRAVGTPTVTLGGAAGSNTPAAPASPGSSGGSSNTHGAA